VQFVRPVRPFVLYEEQLHRPRAGALASVIAMKTTYDPPPPPMGVFGRLAESVAAFLLRAAAVLLPRHHR